MRSFLISTLATLMLIASGGFAQAQKSELAGVVNVNTATTEQLQLLPEWAKSYTKKVDPTGQFVIMAIIRGLVDTALHPVHPLVASTAPA